ncbi:uncharacterized protein LOC114299467 isoform X5 [Camellia sinensis]|uniref:uncharacterized protein LOC114299467 isoform X5 n=1 Tax=Camellia sinensis TaxID=4442 RepID=UPI0010369B5A|nr:uncharacterized protein LOC114299467 isoform X5 [Camellia sinensis]
MFISCIDSEVHRPLATSRDSSSIGSVTTQFLAAFSTASGKTSVQFSESEESDPDWGCWSASQEIRNPSIRIIFPTIERVKNASCGILASKYLACFSQKTWQRLRNVGMIHDTIPYPNNGVNHPVHVKKTWQRLRNVGMPHDAIPYPNDRVNHPVHVKVYC